jgi:hypothetical protein
MNPTALRAVAPWPAVLGVAILVAAWGTAGHDAPRLVLRVDETTTNKQFVERGVALLGEYCPFAWGDVAELPGARPGALAWSDGQIDGWFVCGKDLDRVLRDPRLNAFVMVTYVDGTLWASHPSDDDRWPLEIPDEPSEERWGVLAAIVTDPDPAGHILPTLRAVRWLPRVAQVCLLL